MLMDGLQLILVPIFETDQKHINLASGLDFIHGRCGRYGNLWF